MPERRKPLQPLERRAYVCLQCAKTGSPTRLFLRPEDKAPPKCPYHPRFAMTLQPNKPYRKP